MNRRWFVLVLIPAVLIAAFIVDQQPRSTRAEANPPVVVVGEKPPVRAPTADDVDSVMPGIAPTGTLDTTWYCAGASGDQGGPASATVDVTNPGSSQLTVRVTVQPTEGDPASRDLTIAPHDSAQVVLADIVQVPRMAALVEARGGPVAVAMEVTGPAGSDIAPCSSRPSRSWYLPGGSTDRGAVEEIALYNPFPADAAADVSFVTDDGLRRPPKLQKVPIPAGGYRVVDVAAFQDRRPNLAAIVDVPIGRLVVARTQVFTGTGPPGPDGTAPKGLAVGPAIPRAVLNAVFPFGTRADGLTETIEVLNPTDTDAKIELDIVLDDPAVNGVLAPQPFTVPAHDSLVIAPDDLPRLPDVGHTVTVRSVNGVPIAAEQWQASVAPYPHPGLSVTPGVPLAAPRWVVPAGTNGEVSTLALFNPTGAPARVSLQGFVDGQPAELGDVVVVAPHQRADVSLSRGNASDQLLPVVATSDTPVAAALVRSRSTDVGTAVMPGLPVLDQAVLLPPG